MWRAREIFIFNTDIKAYLCIDRKKSFLEKEFQVFNALVVNS